MRWLTRRSVSLVLMIAAIALPLAIDWCAVSCEVAHAHHASTTAPACHHSSSAGAVVDRVPSRCGHDHAGAVSGFVSVPRASLAAVSAPPVVAAIASRLVRHDVAYHSGPPLDRVASQRSSSLRI
jgi:hypothetical protein